VYSMRHNHVPELKPFDIFVNSALHRIDNPGPTGLLEPEYAGGQINHYWTRSFEEFSLKKSRGDRVPPDAVAFTREVRQFFEWNGPERPAYRSEGWVEYDPPPEALIQRVKLGIIRLLSLPGVLPLVEEVERNFSRLIARYDDLGGLRAIYENLRKDL